MSYLMAANLVIPVPQDVFKDMFKYQRDFM